MFPPCADAYFGRVCGCACAFAERGRGQHRMLRWKDGELKTEIAPGEHDGGYSWSRLPEAHA